MKQQLPVYSLVFMLLGKGACVVSPVWKCSHAWIFRDFYYVHVWDISNRSMMRKLLLQLVTGPTTKCLDYINITAKKRVRRSGKLSFQKEPF